MAAVDKLYESATYRNDKKTTDSLEKVYESLDQEQKELVISYARKHPGSYVSAFELFQTSPIMAAQDNLILCIIFWIHRYNNPTMVNK